MEQVERQMEMFRRLRFGGVLFGLLMYLGTRAAFGMIISVILGALFAVGFYMLCEMQAQRTICQYVADDLKDVLLRAGHEQCIVEIRSLRVGMLTRIYLLGARQRMKGCGKTVTEHIRQSWYFHWIWGLQMIVLEDESEIAQAQALLDQRLLEDLRPDRQKK